MKRLARIPTLHRQSYSLSVRKDTALLKHCPHRLHFDYPLREMSSSTDDEYEDFYRYSSGRWLWDEEAQLFDRYRRFSIPELQSAAAKCTNSNKCILMTKFAEGGFNKVFRLEMDNGSVVFARIPYPNSGPYSLTTASEVATMNFASTILGIPVPKVLAWSAKPDNPVGSEYILMEEAPGTQLGEMWDELELQSKLSIVGDVVAIEKKLLSVSFTLYGNIYFVQDTFPGCQPAIVAYDLPQDLREDVEKRFVIGPVVDRDFWNGERTSMDIDRGPWRKPTEYLKAISEREISWLSGHAKQRSPNALPARSQAQCSPAAHISLYRKFRAVSDFLLPINEELVRSTLWHWDMHASNMFVSANRVTSVIDWQGAWAGPLILQARHPRLVDYNGELMLRLPPLYETLRNEEEKQRIRSQVERSILLWAYESDTKKVNPGLHRLLQLPQGRNRRDVVEFSANTWDGDILPMRECLIRIQKHWNDICHNHQCPIAFNEQELCAHYRDADGWNENAEFWDSIADVVRKDGWTSNENFAQATELFAQLREAGLQSLSGIERTDFERQTRWAVRRRNIED